MTNYQNFEDMMRQLADARRKAKIVNFGKPQPVKKPQLYKPSVTPSPIKLKPLPKVDFAAGSTQLQKTPEPVKLFFRRRPTFVSFDWDNDRRYKHLLQALDSNSRFDFKFKDASSNEINSNDIGRVKSALTAKINLATHFLCIAGEYANQPHADALKIGHINWLNFEAHQAVQAGKKIVVVRLKSDYQIPRELDDAKGLLVEGFKPASILKALNEVK